MKDIVYFFKWNLIFLRSAEMVKFLCYTIAETKIDWIRDNMMRNFSKSSNPFFGFMRAIQIRTRLLLIVFISGIVIAITVLAFYMTSKQLIFKKTEEYVNSNTYNVKYNFDTYLANSIDQLNLLTTDYSVIKNVNGFNHAVETGDWSSYSTIQYELYKTARKIPGLIGLEISGLTSSIAYNTRTLTTGVVSNSRLLNDTIFSTERIHTFGYMELEDRPYISNKGRYAVLIGMQIKSYINGRVIGAVILAISADYLSTALYPPEDITGSNLIVFDPEGKVIAATSDRLALAPELKTIDAHRPLFELRDLNDSHYIVSQLFTDPLGWRILLLTDYRSFSAPLLAEYRWAITVTIVLLLILLISVATVTNSINRPIHQLVRAMEGTSRDYYFPVVRVTGSDELAYLGTTFNEMSRRIQQLIKEIETVNAKKRSAELLTLQSQINPHLLYNTLDSINWIASVTGNQDINRIIATLSDFYRLTLDKGQATHSIQNELRQVESYLKLQALIHQDKITYSIHVQEECKDCLVPKIILQPIVENSLTHGFTEKTLAVEVSVYRHEDYLMIDVSDNGPGVRDYGVNALLPESSYGEEGHGYGLYNINERIKLFFGEQFGISLHPNRPKGLLVRFTLSAQLSSD